MSLFIPCTHCNTEFKLPDTVVIRQSEGAVVTLRCRACQGRIVVTDLELDFEPTRSLLSSPPPPPTPIPARASAPPPPPAPAPSDDEFESVHEEELEDEESPLAATGEEPIEEPEPLALVRRTLSPPPMGELDGLVSDAPRAKRQSRLPAPPRAPTRFTGALPALPPRMAERADDEPGPQSTTPRLSDLAKHSGRASHRPPPAPVNLVEFNGMSALMTPNPALLNPPTVAPVAIDTTPTAKEAVIEDPPASSKSMPAPAPQPEQRGSSSFVMTIAIAAAAAVVAYFGVRQLAEITAPPMTSPTKPVAVAAAIRPAAAPVVEHREAPATAASAASAAPAPVAAVPSAHASATPRNDKPAADRVESTPTPAASTAVAAAPAVPSSEPAPSGKAIDQAVLKAALNEAAARAVSCKQPGDPTGPATVVVTFAPSGRATRAVINGGPFAGTSTGGCIANAMRTASVTPFTGDMVNVRKTVAIE